MCDYSSVVFNKGIDKDIDMGMGKGEIKGMANLIRNYMQATKSSCDAAMNLMKVDSSIRAEVAKMVSEGKDC